MIKLLTAIVSLCVASQAYAAEVGKAAPDFSGNTATGKSVSLADYKGKVVVLEWTNPHCPFVKKFYNVGAMQELQRDAKEKEVVWLSINSSAEGKQGHLSKDEAKALVMEKNAHPTEYVLDADGTIGHLYGAKTTPHMYVINQEGTLVYAGAIDSAPTPSSSDIDGAANYVTAAIDATLAGNEVETSSTQPYGCPVKYE